MLMVGMGEQRGMGGRATLVLAVYHSHGDNCKLFAGRDPILLVLDP